MSISSRMGLMAAAAMSLAVISPMGGLGLGRALRPPEPRRVRHPIEPNRSLDAPKADAPPPPLPAYDVAQAQAAMAAAAKQRKRDKRRR